ncbi:DNA-binding MarR family transcriptional regulator [Catenuloplanes atrovinosus]|uniref:DNA-binding MarR family transcriptional regulator n=2 Tax=Catenuloplanes atrovinosus TaxID=137266 RepID=A0AAE3YTA7_9ACTN|nr:DNA-binding MarR family transcriptional regulator [Catenuloplanes atrovinosus]
MAVLAPSAEMEFATVRDLSNLSDSALSKQAAALEAAGYLSQRKGYVGRRPRTWLSLTKGGRTALRAHIAALRALIDPALDEPAP